MKTKQLKRRIKQNVWGNWYGYEGTRRVITFGEDAQYTQEQKAERWVAGK